MSELDNKDRDDLRKDQFAYVDRDGGEHLPINDESHVRNAISRFNQTDFESDAAKDRADAQYKTAMERCEPMKGNAQDVCEKEAKAARDKSKADVSAATKGTTESRADAVETKAKADYRVAMERCEPLKGNAQDACESKAKATLDQAQANADKRRKN